MHIGIYVRVCVREYVCGRRLLDGVALGPVLEIETFGGCLHA